MKGPYDLKNREVAAKYVAKQLEEMAALYRNIIEVADHFELRVCERLEWPEGMRLGHNINMQAEVYWNPSSKHC